MGNAVAINEAPRPMTTPMQLLESAVKGNVDAGQLEKLMDLQERWEANEARRAFAHALADFQSEVPLIHKSRKGDKATYAPLEQVIETIQPHMHRHGFSVRFDTEMTSVEGSPAILTATCYLTHRMGHTESNHFATPIDMGPTNREGKRVMNSAQAVASARSYAKRYALGDALNLAFTDEDDDARSLNTAPNPDNEPATEKQLAVIQEYREAGKIPEQTEAWLAKQETLTTKQAAALITKLNKADKS